MISHLLQEWEWGIVRVQLRKWCKPPQGWIKVNVDEACRVGVHYIGAECVIRDEHDQFLRVRTNKIKDRCKRGRSLEFQRSPAVDERMENKSPHIWAGCKISGGCNPWSSKKSFFHTIIEECVGWFVSTSCLFFVWSHEVVPCFICKLILLKRSNARAIVLKKQYSLRLKKSELVWLSRWLRKR